MNKYFRYFFFFVVITCHLSCADHIPHTRFYRKGKRNVAFLKEASDYILKENLNNSFYQERWIGLENIKDKKIARKLHRIGILGVKIQPNKHERELYPDSSIVFVKESFPFISRHWHERFAVVYKAKIDTTIYPNKKYDRLSDKQLLYKVADKIYYYKDVYFPCM